MWSWKHDFSDPRNEFVSVSINVVRVSIANILTVRKADHFVYGCDFSEVAINLLRDHKLYDPKRSDAFVLDATSEEWSLVPFAPSSLDVILLIFTLSAIDPQK